MIVTNNAASSTTKFNITGGTYMTVSGSAGADTLAGNAVPTLVGGVETTPFLVEPVLTN